MENKILVATDLSARADRAVLRAVKLAKEFNAKLIIVSVIDNDLPKAIKDHYESNAKNEISLCLKGNSDNLNYEIKVCEGAPYSEILRISNQENVSLIVLGMHRHINDNQPMIGSVIKRLIKNTNKPVLVVKNRAEGNYNRVLSALDFNIQSSNAFQTAFQLFTASQFYLLNCYQVPFAGFIGEDNDVEQDINTGNKDILKQLVGQLLDKYAVKPNSVKIETVVKKGEVLEVLSKEVEKIAPDLITLGTYGRDGFARALITNSTNNILVNPPSDVLVAGKYVNCEIVSEFLNQNNSKLKAV